VADAEPLSTGEQGQERVNLYIPVETRQRLRRAAAIRKTSEGGTGRWLLEHALDWFEGLSREEKESA